MHEILPLHDGTTRGARMTQTTHGTAVLSSWQVKLAQRVAQLERGKAYNVTVWVPFSNDEPVWNVVELGKIENGR